MKTLKKIDGSFKDPSGNVFEYNDRIIRSIEKIFIDQSIFLLIK